MKKRLWFIGVVIWVFFVGFTLYPIAELTRIILIYRAEAAASEWNYQMPAGITTVTAFNIELAIMWTAYAMFLGLSVIASRLMAKQITRT